MPTRRQGTLAIIGVIAASVSLALLVGQARRMRDRDRPPGETLVLADGVHVQVEARGCDVADLAMRLPRDVDGALRAVRGRQLEQALNGTADGKCEPGLVDRAGELRGFVRDRARSLSQSGRPVLLVGWDGADPRVIEDLLKAGHLDVLGRLRASGAYGQLVSHAPYLSPLLWTSVATGKRPEEHGILDFVEPAADGTLQPIGAGCRRSTTLWQIASDLGRSALVVNWWATEPEDAIRGEVISDRWIRDPGFASASGHLRARVAKDDPAVASVWRRLVRGDGPEEAGDTELRGFIAEALTAHRAALRGLASDPDLALIYYQLIDEAGHLFEREMPPRQSGVSEGRYARYGGVVHGTYLLLDALLGELVAAAPGREIIVISDHGFVYGLERRRTLGLRDPLSDMLHTPSGMYVMNGSFAVGEGPVLDLHDIAPTVLAALGIPPANDMAGKLAPIFQGPPLKPVATHEVDLAPSTFGLLTGEGCGAPVAVATNREALEKLESLGYLQGDGAADGVAVMPLANLGRSLMDARRPAEARRAFALASARRPHDATLGQLLLEATLAAGGGSAADAETLARRWLRDGDGTIQAELAFPVVQLRLRQGDEPGARELAAEAGESSMGGILASLLVALWTEDRATTERLFGKALELDVLRAVDAVQGLAEVFPERALTIDRLLERYADGLPLAELARSPSSGLSGYPEPTLARARRASLSSPSAVDKLWLRRAEAYRRRDAAPPR